MHSREAKLDQERSNFQSGFCICFIVDLLMQHKFGCLNPINRSWRTLTPQPYIGCPYPCPWVLGGHGCDIIGNIISNVISFEYMGAIWIAWVGMGGHRSLLMSVVWVRVQTWRKCWALLNTQAIAELVWNCQVGIVNEYVEWPGERSFLPYCKVGAPIPVSAPIPGCIQGTSIRVTPILGGWRNLLL